MRRLTSWEIDADLPSVSPAVSGPSRDRIIFETYGHGGPPEGTVPAVAAIPADCRTVADCTSRIRYLTSPRATSGARVENFNPAWSPDGRQVAYARFTDDPLAVPRFHSDIWTSRWDGKDPARVSASELLEFRPSWGRSPVATS